MKGWIFRDCLNSLCKQSYKNMEIIVVDYDPIDSPIWKKNKG